MASGWVNVLNDIVVEFCHVLAIFTIVVGVCKAIFIYLKDLFTEFKAIDAMEESRLEIGHSFSLGLALLIGASILKTTLDPTWNEIGQLVVIIIIRTALNYFLTKDLKPNCKNKN